MLRLSADVRRVRIAGIEDLSALPGAGCCAIDFGTRPESGEVFEKLCRSLGAQLGTTIEDCEPDARDRDPTVLEDLLCGLSREGCDLWAVTVHFLRADSGPLGDHPAPPLPRTTFFVTQAGGPGGAAADSIASAPP